VPPQHHHARAHSSHQTRHQPQAAYGTLFSAINSQLTGLILFYVGCAQCCVKPQKISLLVDIACTKAGKRNKEEKQESISANTLREGICTSSVGLASVWAVPQREGARWRRRRRQKTSRPGAYIDRSRAFTWHPSRSFIYPAALTQTSQQHQGRQRPAPQPYFPFQSTASSPSSLTHKPCRSLHH